MQANISGSTSRPEIEIYESAEKLIHIKIDPEVSAFRINCLNVKRVFSVYEEVSRRHTYTVLLNEYSQPLGKIEKDHLLDQTGLVDVEDIKLNYRIRTMPKGDIYLFLAEESKEVFNCSINPQSFAAMNESQVAILLFSICWFAYLSKNKQSLLSLSLS